MIFIALGRSETTKMTHLILTGCTGTAGSAILAYCIRSSSVSKVSVLSRRPVKQAAGHEKVKVIIHEDFKSYPDGVLDQLNGATGCVWALGVATGQVDSDRYVYNTLADRHSVRSFYVNVNYFQRISKNYARVPSGCRKSLLFFEPTVQFRLHLWGRGKLPASPYHIQSLLTVIRLLTLISQATRNPGRFSQPFARVKGATELSLLSLISTYPSLRICNVRPAFIDDECNHLKEGRKPFSYRMMDYGAPVLRTLLPSLVSPTKHLAEVLVRCAKEEKGKEETRGWLKGKGVTWDEDVPFGVLIENIGLRQLAGI